MAWAPSTPGALAELQAYASAHGLLVSSRINKVWIGGREDVILLNGSEDLTEGCGAGSGADGDAGEPCPAVDRCERWSGAALGARGIGGTRGAVLDAAASTVLRRLRSRPPASLAFVAAFSGTSSAARAVCAPQYTPRQTVLVTDDAQEGDSWIDENVLSVRGGASRTRAVAVDAEWVSDGSPWRHAPTDAAILQLSTEKACLVLAVGRCGLSPRLLELLMSPNVAKVLKDLRQDWRVLLPRMQAHVGGYNLGAALTPAGCGWCEVADLTPYHDRMCALSSLTTAFLGVEYALKDSGIDHSAWDAWPLSEVQRAYAAGDVCAVADVVAAIDDAEWRRAGPSEEESFRPDANPYTRGK